MGLFDKKYCAICGSKAGLLLRQKIAGGFICGDCSGKCSPNMTWRQFEAMSADDIIAHLDYVAQNDMLYRTEFQETYSINTGILGGTRVVSVDERNGWWVAAAAARPDIMSFDQVLNWRLELDTSYLSEEERRKPGRRFPPMPPYGMPACPPDQEITGMHVIVRVNHPWFDEVKLDVMSAIFVSEGDIRAGYECAQQIFSYFEHQTGVARAAASAQAVAAAQQAAQYAQAAQIQAAQIQAAQAVQAAQSVQAAGEDPLETVRKLKELLDIGAITQQEFDAKKRQLLNL